MQNVEMNNRFIDICMPYIEKFGTPEQIEKFIPPMVSGECISCIAMTEPGAGSDLQGEALFEVSNILSNFRYKNIR